MTSDADMEKGSSSSGKADEFQVDLHIFVQQVLELAITMERRGVDFYQMVAESYEDSRLRNFFLRLMGMELNHEKELQDLIKEFSEEQTEKLAFDEDLTDREYFKYLKNLTLKKVFPDGLDLFGDLDSFKEPTDALNMALRIEENSIALYRALNRFQLSEKATSAIEKLISDEQEHKREIADILHTTR